ncbi:hypothetical protein PoB_005534100 [Plakobranchus ocellatus]|uniref:Uncharacterized protein n=1 Tax=Plakobranchus ocellatus TaxID=259542 RepID=A0AAV4C813_9GAST|nr:hypothetical protein PoB_005534100 [Plakobranchus ocellatus]
MRGERRNPRTHWPVLFMWSYLTSKSYKSRRFSRSNQSLAIQTPRPQATLLLLSLSERAEAHNPLTSMKLQADIFQPVSPLQVGQRLQVTPTSPGLDEAHTRNCPDKRPRRHTSQCAKRKGRCRVAVSDSPPRGTGLEARMAM